MNSEKTASASRVSRKPVVIPSGVEVKLADQVLAIKGPKGNFSLPIHPFVTIAIDSGKILVSENKNIGYCRNGKEARLRKSIPGTTRANIANAIVGVKDSFEKKMNMIGVGYKAQSKGKVLGLSLGFSHPVDVTVLEGITIETPTPTEIIVRGTDKNLVGKVSAHIRDFRPPEPYKGKGVRYANETVVKKETKKK